MHDGDELNNSMTRTKWKRIVDDSSCRWTEDDESFGSHIGNCRASIPEFILAVGTKRLCDGHGVSLYE